MLLEVSLNPTVKKKSAATPVSQLRRSFQEGKDDCSPSSLNKCARAMSRKADGFRVPSSGAKVPPTPQTGSTGGPCDPHGHLLTLGSLSQLFARFGAQ